MRAIKKVDFEIETEKGYEVEQVAIKKMRFEAFHDVLAIVNEIYSLIQKDEALRILFEEIFSAGEEEELDPEAVKNFSKEELAEIKADNRRAAEQRFLRGVMGSFPLLLVHLPKQATELLVAMTGIDRKLLGQQDFDTVLDVYEAMLEVNELEKLFDRVKKSLDATKRALAFLNKRKKATTA